LYETKLFHLSTTAGQTKAIRIKSFLHTLSNSKHTTHLDIPSKGLGASTLVFTPDSRRLVVGHVQSGEIIVIALPSPTFDVELRREEMEVEVVKCFQMGGNTIHGRVIAGSTKKHRRRNGRATTTANGNGNGNGNGIEHETEVVNGHEDIEIDDIVEEEQDEEEEAEEEVKAEGKEEEQTQSWISCLAASGDGQWLSSGDTSGRVTIFNLDTLQVSSTFTFYTVPSDFTLREGESRESKQGGIIESRTSGGGCNQTET
jgi:U3 small nucleolar RNA-associated protein 4